jgi:hypothetical protein
MWFWMSSILIFSVTCTINVKQMRDLKDSDYNGSDTLIGDIILD